MNDKLLERIHKLQQALRELYWDVGEIYLEAYRADPRWANDPVVQELLGGSEVLNTSNKPGMDHLVDTPHSTERHVVGFGEIHPESGK